MNSFLILWNQCCSWWIARVTLTHEFPPHKCLIKHRHIIYLLYVYEVSSVVIQRASYTQNYVRTNQPNYDNPRTLAPTNKTCRLSYLLQILQVCTGKIQLLWELARFQVTPREVVPTSENRSLANIFFDTLTVYSCLVSIALVFNMEYFANFSTLVVY